MSPILLLTHSQDHYTIDRVQAHLLQQGCQAVRIDTDLFPTQCSVQTRWQQGSVQHDMHAGHQRIRLDGNSAIWCRRLWPNAAPSRLAGRAAARAHQACQHTFLDTLGSVQETFFLDHPWHQQRANAKIHQLHVASDAGLPVPATLVSNDLDQVRAFKAEHGSIVSKTLSAYIADYDLASDFVFTQIVDDPSDAQWQHITQHPQIFQKTIHKLKEYRVVWVGGRSFTASMQIDQPRSAAVDWRHPELGQQFVWREDELPEPLMAALGRLMHGLSLHYGAADLALDEAGDYWFFELNPTGEYGWFERDLAYPISATIAELLMEKRDPYVHPYHHPQP